MNSEELQELIKAAFKGVKLDGGVSLSASTEMDFWGEPEPDTNVHTRTEVEIKDNWLALSTETLERYAHTGHLDAKGFRYYIPAFMLSLLNDYDDTSERHSITFSMLRPSKDNWDYEMRRYSLLNQKHRHAIAHFLQELPSVVEVDYADQKFIERALLIYWHEYL